MEKDERLLPLPNAGNLQTPKEDYPASYSPFYDDDSVEQKRSIVEYLNIVYKRLPIILALTVITTTVVAFYMYRQPSVYEAKTEMVIEPRKPKATQQTTIINLGNDATYYNTQLQLLQNPDLMRQVVIRLGLYRDPNLFGVQSKGFVSTLRAMVSGEKEVQNNLASLPVITQTEGDAIQTDQVALTPEEKARVDGYAWRLLGGLRINQVEKTNIVNIFVSSTNPELSARVADKTAEVFIEQDIERSTQGAKKSLVDLTDSIERLKTTISSQTQQLIGEQARSGIPLTGDAGTTFNAGRLQSVSDSLLKATDERGRIEADYAAALAANARGEILSKLVANPTVQALRTALSARKAAQAARIDQLNNQIQDLSVARSNLLARYTEDYKKSSQSTNKLKTVRSN
jgi:uncharacterized protein involved in exopolysaccharide biosynthesis